MDGLINKKELGNEIRRIYAEHYVDTNSQTVHDIFHAVLKRIDRAKTVDAEPVVHGHWIKGRLSFTTSLGTEGTDDEWCCSACGFSFNPNKRNIPCCPEPDFCERCGAKMDER